MTATGRNTRDWTIAQMLYRDPVPDHPARWAHRCEKYVVECPLKSGAETLVAAWLDAVPARREHLHVVHYYPRNYVAMARQLRAEGRVIS
jgi:hypothetical protein